MMTPIDNVIWLIDKSERTFSYILIGFLEVFTYAKKLFSTQFRLTKVILRAFSLLGLASLEKHRGLKAT